MRVRKGHRRLRWLPTQTSIHQGKLQFPKERGSCFQRLSSHVQDK